MVAAVHEVIKEHALLRIIARCHRIVIGITVMILVSAANARKVCFSRLPVLNAAEPKRTGAPVHLKKRINIIVKPVAI